MTAWTTRNRPARHVAGLAFGLLATALMGRGSVRVNGKP
jgi:hypothetical protein